MNPIFSYSENQTILGVEKCMKKRLLFMPLIIILFFSFVSCSKKEPEITGKWILALEDGVETTDEENYLDFYSDGTGIASGTDSDGLLWHYDCTWVTEDGRLKLTLNLGLLGSTANSYAYEIDGDTLILTNDDKNTATYYKETE